MLGDTKEQQEQHTVSQEPQDNIIQKRKADLLCLYKMYKAINQILKAKETNQPYSQSLIELSRLAGGISYNDKDSHCIRNKYGNVENGICFEHIYRLHLILQSENLAAAQKREESEQVMGLAETLENLNRLEQSLKEERDLLQRQLEFQRHPSFFQDLKRLEEKILFVFRSEEKFITTECEELLKISVDGLVGQRNCGTLGSRLSDFEKIVERDYQVIVLKKILLEAKFNKEDLDFTDKDNRYFLARKLSILGALIQELPAKGSVLEFKIAMQGISDIRDILIQRHGNLIVRCKPEVCQPISAVLHNTLTKIQVQTNSYLNAQVVDIKQSGELKQACELLFKALEGNRTEKEHILLKRLKQVDSELLYFESIESNTRIRKDKKEYIFQKITLMVELYIRDIMKKRMENTSHIFFDTQNVDLIIQNSKSPTNRNLQVAYLIPTSIIMLNNIGSTYTRLGLYHYAIEYFERALKGSLDRSKLAREKLNNDGFAANTAVIESSKVMIRVDLYVFSIQGNLVNVYLLQGDYKNAFRLVNDLLAKTANGSLECASDKFLNELGITVCNMAHCFFEKNLFEQAITLYQKGVQLIKDENFREKFFPELAHAYMKSGQFKKAQELCDATLNKMNAQVGFSALLMKAYLLLREDDLEEAEKHIKESSEFFKKQEGVLKKLMGDDCIFLEISILNAKLSLLSIKKDKAEQDLLLIEQEFKIIFDRLKPSFQVSKKVGKYYCCLSGAYSSFIDPKYRNTNPDLSNLRKSEKYLAEAEKILSSGSINNRDLRKTSSNLANAYSDYAMKMSGNSSIAFFLKALALQKKYGFDNTLTRLNLGTIYHNRAEKFFGNGDSQFAILDYKRAIEFIPKVEENDPLIKDKLEQLLILGMSYERVGECASNVQYLIKAKSCYDLFLSHSETTHEDYQMVIQYKEQCKGKIQKVLPVSLTYQYDAHQSAVNSAEDQQVNQRAPVADLFQSKV